MVFGILKLSYNFSGESQLKGGICGTGFFVTPIIWYLKDVDGILLTIHSINPVGQLVELTHKVIVFGEIPPLNDWLYATSFSVAFFLAGYWIFNKFQERIVEEL